MTKQQFIEIFEQAIAADPGEIQGDEQLSEVAGWDSLAILSFQSDMDDVHKLVVPAEEIRKAKSVADLMKACGVED